MNAVGANQDVGGNARAVVEPGLDMVAVVAERQEAMPEMDVLGRKPRGDHVQQIGAMDRDMRRAVEFFALRIERRTLQGAAVVPATLMRARGANALAQQPLAEAKADQHTGRVRPPIDAAADMGQRRRLLVKIRLEPGLAQRQRGGEAPNAATDDRYPKWRSAHARGVMLSPSRRSARPRSARQRRNRSTPPDRKRKSLTS